MSNKESEQNFDSEYGSLPAISRVRQENITLDWEGVRSEKLLQLKRSRSSKKGILTKTQNEIQRLMLNSNNYDLVKDRIEEFKQFLQEFKDAHAAYHSQLRDENEIKESNNYYDATVRLGTDLARDVGNWISSTESQEELHPEDSVSNAGSRASSKFSRRSKKASTIGSRTSSRASSISAAKVKAAAKRAVLQAEAANLERFHALQNEELSLQQRRRALELQTEIGKARAEELVYGEAEADHEATPSSFVPAANRRTYSRNTVNDCLPESRPPKTEPISDKSDNGIQNSTQGPKVSKSLNPNADSWPFDDLRPTVKPSSLHTVKEEPAKENHGPPDTFLERLLATQSQQNSVMQQLLQRQQESTLALTLPQPEVPTFGGDPIEYWGFIRAFQNVIESKTTNDSIRLYYLVQYTSGEVQELVSSCLSMKPEEGYPEARGLLKKRYGQSYRIASAYVSKLTKGPAIKAEDSSALRRFSILLTACKNTLKEIGYLSKVENPDTLKMIVNRLPYGLKLKWRDVADRITETEEREITIEDIDGFVSSRARASSHAIFGNVTRDNPVPPVGLKSRNKSHPKASNFAVGAVSQQETRLLVNGNNQKCPLCNAQHWLSHCDDFKKRSLKDRFDFVRSKKLCDNCLAPGHFSNACSKESFCRVTGCNVHTKHSSFLHPKNNGPAGDFASGARNASGTGATQQVDNQKVHNGFVDGRNQALGRHSGQIQASATGLAILPVKVKAKGSDRMIKTYAFLDNGSNASFCSEKLAKQLDLSGTKTTLSLTTMEREDSKTDCRVVALEVQDLDEDHLFELPVVFTRPSLPVTTESVANQQDIEKWRHLSEVKIPNIDADVGLLIGSDAPEILEPKQVIPSQNGGPYAIRTILGWVINGPLSKITNANTRTANFIKADQTLNEQFQSYCNMEFNDSAYSAGISMSANDKHALELMRGSINVEDGHYQLALPWRNDPPCLENNRSVVDHRLKLLKRRLSRDPNLRSKYKDCMEDLLEKGYATRAQAATTQGKTWYLPHHAVQHPAKPGKVRVVFDCSAKYRGKSLNDELLQGPDLTNSLVGVLTRFRQESVAFMSDVEAMFHQVRVNPEDRSALQFLWWPDGNLYLEPEELMMTVHLFGAVSSPSCANFALKKTAEDNREDFSTEAVRTVERNFYVDDCLKSVRSEEDAVRLSSELSQLLKRGGFRLTKWLSNKRKVVESVPESDRAASVRDLDFDHTLVERALGVQWHVTSDTFGFKIATKDKPPTRRGILSVISSIYDPLGFVAPFHLSAKILLQNLCRKQLAWDDTIPEGDIIRWRRWLEDLPRLEQFSIDRCFKPQKFGDIVSCQLHHFSDASQVAYGAVSYLRFVNARHEIHCSFVMGKSRLSPLKPVTIPRLELSAAVLSTGLDRMIRKEVELPINDSFYWTDSTCVLRYIANSERRYKTFVANRVAAIREQSIPSQWQYVGTKTNPADDASRGLSADDIIGHNRWIQGPEFLWLSEENWPRMPAAIEEEITQIPLEEVAATFATMTCSPDYDVEEVFKRFSSWYSLKRFVAWLLRFRNRLRDAVVKRKTGDPLQSQKDQKIDALKVCELKDAEREIIKVVQSRHFYDELLSLQGGASKTANPSKIKSAKKSSHIYKLDPNLSRGLICVGGRLQRSPISEEAKHPAILPKQHHVSDLIIRHYHLRCGHSGLEHTLSMIREKYWIVQARVSLRRVLNGCFHCKRTQAVVGQQKMANLPEDRVCPSQPPFSHVGVDCFGPLLVRRGRRTVKRYGVLFTCLAVRAIHIEVAHSLDTDSFIHALRRFIARRGQPQRIRSDNGSNFVRGEKELREAIQDWNQEKIHEFLLAKNIEWVFNPPAGSHHGGVWERCIRTTRKVMKALLQNQALDDEGLLTLLCEVESIINGRPLTKVSDDPRDPEALTPNHLLMLRSGSTLPPGAFAKDDSFSRRRWRHVQYLADVFWRRWIREYLPALQERRKWNKATRNYAVNDVVLVLDESTPRSSWPLGRVLEVHQSRDDGLVRSLKVKTRTSVLTRPIDKVVLLEAADQ